MCVCQATATQELCLFYLDCRQRIIIYFSNFRIHAWASREIVKIQIIYEYDRRKFPPSTTDNKFSLPFPNRFQLDWPFYCLHMTATWLRFLFSVAVAVSVVRVVKKTVYLKIGLFNITHGSDLAISLPHLLSFIHLTKMDLLKKIPEH